MKSFLFAVLLLAGCAIPGERPPLNDDRTVLVRLGMTRDDTLHLLGAPDERMKFPLSGSEAWDYRYQDTWGFLVSFSVTFGPEGGVVSRFSQRLNDGGDLGK